ncbi:hypothetical protein D9619_008970 [Psilocybe cf. subviscida]|uniref:Uncharacterized protein n=1 Tax=Psilocybe cf. subviscida TaxID=2480587 RepID=A0A8H5BW17_9AGAR|nr:hypothetical protein D9619_008970 [Psilocybe cf. subviscida]
MRKARRRRAQREAHGVGDPYDQYHPQAYFPSRSIRVVQQPALFHITLVAHSRLPSLCFPGTRLHSPPPDPVCLVPMVVTSSPRPRSSSANYAHEDEWL